MLASLTDMPRPHGKEAQDRRLFYYLMPYSSAQGILLLKNLLSYFQRFHAFHWINILLTTDAMLPKEVKPKACIKAMLQFKQTWSNLYQNRFKNT